MGRGLAQRRRAANFMKAKKVRCCVARAIALVMGQPLCLEGGAGSLGEGRCHRPATPACQGRWRLHAPLAAADASAEG